MFSPRQNYKLVHSVREGRPSTRDCSFSCPSAFQIRNGRRTDHSRLPPLPSLPLSLSPSFYPPLSGRERTDGRTDLQAATGVTDRRRHEAAAAAASGLCARFEAAQFERPSFLRSAYHSITGSCRRARSAGSSDRRARRIP